MRYLIFVTMIFFSTLLLFARPTLAVKVEQVVTTNGIRAWLVRDHTNPIISLRFAFKGGAALDPKNKSGLANLVASSLDEGAGELNSKAFQQNLEDHAIRMRFQAGIDTFSGRLQTLARHRDKAFNLLGMALTTPRFDEEPLERIRAQLLVRLKRDEESPHSIASKALRRALYGSHPYSKSPDGTPDSLKRIKAEDLRAFITRRFARNNLVIGVVGDVTKRDLKSLLDNTFGDLNSKATDWQIPYVKAKTEGQTIIIDKTVPQSAILFADQGLLRKDPDFYAAYVMNHILGGGGFTSRLYSEVREKRGLAYSISSNLNPRQASATLVGGAGTSNARVKETLEVIKTQWQRMAVDGVDEDELNDAKTYLTGAYPLRFSESGRIARMLVGMQLDGLSLNYIQKRNGFIAAVNRKDIARVAKKLLAVNRLVTIVVGQPKGMSTSQ